MLCSGASWGPTDIDNYPGIHHSDMSTPLMSPSICTTVQCCSPSTCAQHSKPPAPVALPPRCGATLPTMHQALCAHLARECALWPRHASDVPPPRCATAQFCSPCTMRAPCASKQHLLHCPNDVSQYRYRSAILSPMQSVRPMRHAHKKQRLEANSPTVTPTVRCCSPSLVLVQAWSVRSTEHGISSTARHLRCFRKICVKRCA